MDRPINLSADDSSAMGLITPITPAEERVLSALGSGASNRRIAADLVISPRTVESHMSSLLAKTGCRNRTQLLLWAMSRP
jgi:DNA-binding NarL/FixJ family response regulator